MRASTLVVAVWLLAMAALADPASAQRPGRGQFNAELSTTAIAFPTPGIADFDAGWIEYPGMTVFIQSRPPNETWELRIRAEDPSMGVYGKPSTDILWRTDATSSWVPLATTDELVVQGQGDQDVTVYFRVRLNWDLDIPGAYAVDVTFVAARL